MTSLRIAEVRRSPVATIGYTHGLEIFSVTLEVVVIIHLIRTVHRSRYSTINQSSHHSSARHLEVAERRNEEQTVMSANAPT